ncbi:efflux RND transporter periplasmic adaptor subunit [Psychrobium sp. nBUS_13]|uniref:efflux RND transporter periplasmic adaptor subunit n=1 Tax=Psychrobium sp. nBUS_13 TaxID=3395319 RepID=UPI003EC06655
MNKSIMLASGLTGLLIIWMLSGGNDAPVTEEVSQASESEKLMSVVVKSSDAQLVAKKITVQGQVEPNRVLSLKTEVDGKIIALPLALGSRVTKGDVLAKVSLKTRLSQREQAVANVAYQTQELAATKKLFDRKLESGSRLSLQQANLAAAKASLQQIDYDIKNSTIIAPFDGVFDCRYVELGDYLDKGQQVVSLVDDLQLKITAMVPQQQVDGLVLGQDVTASLINGEAITGALSFISATADENTRSYRIEVLVSNKEHRRLVGMTASLGIPVKEVEGHLVSASSISLDNQGRLQVKAVNENNEVVAYPVTIVRTDSDKVWLSGLPAHVSLITLGQDFVIAGQAVQVSQG